MVYDPTNDTSIIISSNIDKSKSILKQKLMERHFRNFGSFLVVRPTITVTDEFIFLYLPNSSCILSNSNKTLTTLNKVEFSFDLSIF